MNWYLPESTQSSMGQGQRKRGESSPWISPRLLSLQEIFPRRWLWHCPAESACSFVAKKKKKKDKVTFKLLWSKGKYKHTKCKRLLKCETAPVVNNLPLNNSTYRDKEKTFILNPIILISGENVLIGNSLKAAGLANLKYSMSGFWTNCASLVQRQEAAFQNNFSPQGMKMDV